MSELMSTVFLFFGCAAWGILAPGAGIEPGPQQWKRWVLTTGLPGNSLFHVIFTGQESSEIGEVEIIISIL